MQPMTERTARERFWRDICDASWALSMLLALNLLLLVGLGFSALFVTPGTTTFYVSILSAVIILTSLLLISIVILQCRKRTS